MPRNSKGKTQRKDAGKLSVTAISSQSSQNTLNNNNNDETNENESLNQEEASIINNDTNNSAPANLSSVNQTALRNEDSKLDTVDKSSQNASINNEEEDNNMDINENQQEQELVIPQAQIEPVPEESMSQSISPKPSRIPVFNRNSCSLTSPPIRSTIQLNSTVSQIPSPPY